jgi:molybdenum cofactor synthesis domain-containing protein
MLLYRGMPIKVPTAVVISIGDELLRGDTLDTNMNFLCTELSSRGVVVQRCLTLPDIYDVIVTEVRACAGLYDHVITGGGIGPTPDDLTRPAVAEAMGRELEINDVALERYQRERGTALNAGQIEMCRLPAGCELIWPSHPCPPGFIVGNVVVLPGVPVVLKDMWLSIAGRFSGTPFHSARFRADAGESRWAHIMRDFVARYPQLQFGSYPKAGQPWFAEVLVRGYDKALVRQAAAEFEQRIAEVE